MNLTKSIVLVGSLALSVTASFSQSPDGLRYLDDLNAAQVKTVVETQYKAYIKPENAEKYAFMGITADDFQKELSFGEPLRLHTIPPKAVVEYNDDTPLDNVLHASRDWYVPVLFGDSAKAMFIVSKVKGVWKIVSLSHSDLAPEIQELRKGWPDEEPTLVANFQSKSYFFSFLKRGRPNLTKFDVGPRARGRVAAVIRNARGKYDTLGDVKATIESVREINRKIYKNR
ncbi:MAG: hypothetical protein GF344_17115 [Chitinivibrionales bacterium]|nr:hypothetical protein [Chitinivibrionales bacterium]MBD3358403.1 hypothetical protein [Chitinivibrionales bacterium]